MILYPESFLSCGGAAIYNKRLTRNKGRFLRSQEQSHAAYLVRLANTRNRLSGFDPLSILLVLPEVLAEVRLNQTGRYRIHSNTARSER